MKLRLIIDYELPDDTHHSIDERLNTERWLLGIEGVNAYFKTQCKIIRKTESIEKADIRLELREDRNGEKSKEEGAKEGAKTT